MSRPKTRYRAIQPLASWVPLVLAALLIALATLVPLGSSAPRFHWRIEIPDVLVNLVLYFPLGFLLARRRWSLGRIVVLGAVVSGAVELLQGTLIAGRRGSPVDIAVDVAGATLGAAALGAWQRAVGPRHTWVRGRLAVLLCLPMLGWLGSGWLLAPDPPDTPNWYSLWAQQYLDTEPFRGSLLEVRLQGREVPDGVLDGVPALRADALANALRLDVTILSDGPTAGPTQLASIGDRRDGTVIGVEQVNNDLMLYWASRGSALGLRPPRLTFADAGRARRGERLTIRASVTRSKAGISVLGPAGEHSEERSLTPLTGWRNLIPSRELSAPAQRLFDLVWTLALVGYALVAVRVLRVVRLSY